MPAAALNAALSLAQFTQNPMVGAVAAKAAAFARSGGGKSLCIVFGVALAIALVVFVVKYLQWRKRWNRYVACGACMERFRNRIVNLAGQRPLSSRLLPAPKYGSDFSYCMWIYVGDWYTHFGRWKSVFCKSPNFPTGCPALTWNMVGAQCPGIWMADKTNDLRVVVQTEIAVPSVCVADAVDAIVVDNPGTTACDVYCPASSKAPESTCVSATHTDTKETARCDATNPQGLTCVCRPPETAAVKRARTPESIAACITSNPGVVTTQLGILEYADLKNIPVGKWFHLVVVVRGKLIEIYRDAELFSTTTLTGTPKMNLGMGRFGAANPYSGRMANFRYMPHALPLPIIQHLYAYEKAWDFRSDKDPMQEDVG